MFLSHLTEAHLTDHNHFTLLCQYLCCLYLTFLKFQIHEATPSPSVIDEEDELPELNFMTFGKQGGRKSTLASRGPGGGRSSVAPSKGPGRKSSMASRGPSKTSKSRVSFQAQQQPTDKRPLSTAPPNKKKLNSSSKQKLG